PLLWCRLRAGRWSAGPSLFLPVTPAVVLCFVVVSVFVWKGVAVHAEEPPLSGGAAPLRILDAGRVSYEGRPRGVCCRSLAGEAGARQAGSGAGKLRGPAP